jgi:hypothetical protein
MFNRALEIDPQYALAYAGLADCYAQMIDKYYETDKTFFANDQPPAITITVILVAISASSSVKAGLRISVWQQ